MPNKYGSRWICKPTRLAIYLRDHFACVYCEKDLHGAHVRGVTLDHIVSRERGGSNRPTNLVTACKACNDSKGDTPWLQWVRGRFPDPHIVVARVKRQTRRTLTKHRPLARAIIMGDENQPYVTRSLYIPVPRSHFPAPSISESWRRELTTATR